MTEAWRERLRHWLWERSPRNRDEARLLGAGRIVVVMTRDLSDGQLSMRAMSLVYTTLLSLVPLLALGVSLFKALGIHNALQPALANLLSPLGPQGAELTAQIIAFVENIKIGVLGALGVGLLLYTVVSMLQKIEGSFNYVWRIDEPRRLGQRFSEYLTVVMVGPVAVFAALGITASVLNSRVAEALAAYEPFGLLLFLAGKLVPYVLIIAAFTFLYAFIPNTRVQTRAALAGGILAGVLWQTGSAAFAAFVASATNYNAIYSGFAIVIFLLIWLYFAWLILLLGCLLSYYVQNPERLTPHREPRVPGVRAFEQAGFEVVRTVGRAFMEGAPAPSLADLRARLDAGPEHCDRVVELLLHHGVLAESSDAPPRLRPGRDFAALTLAELWRTLRGGTRPRGEPEDRGSPSGRLLAEADRAFAEAAGGQSVRDWIAGDPDAGSPGDAPAL